MLEVIETYIGGPVRLSSTPSRLLGLVTLTAVGVLGCARPKPDLESETRTPESQRLSTAAVALTGSWELGLHPPPQRATPGIRLTVTIDSVRDGNLHGRLTHLFAGNVGFDPSAYSPFHGALEDDSIVHVPISRADTDAGRLVLRGHLVRDTIRLTTFVIGPDTLRGGTARWILVKRK